MNGKLDKRMVTSLLLCLTLLVSGIAPPLLSESTEMRKILKVDSTDKASSATPSFWFLKRNLTLGEEEYSNLRNSIEARGFEYRAVNNISSAMVGVDVLMILASEQLVGVNLTFVKTFLREGGSLLFAPSYKEPFGAENLLEMIGLNSTAPTVRNNVTGVEKVTLSDTWNMSSYLYEDVSSITIRNGTVITEAEEKKERLNFTIKKHPSLWGNNTTVSGENGKVERRGENVTLSYECELWTGGRVVVLPSCLMVADPFFSENEQFIGNVIDWLSKTEQHILVENLSVTPSKVNIDSKNPEINVTFQIVDEEFHSIKVENLTVVVERLGEVQISKEVDTSITSYKATQIEFPSDMKAGLVYVLVQAYKSFYGFSWSNRVGITLSPTWVSEPPLLTKVLLTLCFVAPVVTSCFFILKSRRNYKKNKKVIKELEKEKVES